MARSRNIKPGFFTNEVLGELPMSARLLFIGMWCHADREGRLEDRMKRLKPQIFPYDECDIEGLAQCLHSAGMVLRYVVDNKGYIQVLNFLKHQNPHVKEAHSTIPASDSPGTTTIPAGLIPDSLLPITDSPLPSTPLCALTARQMVWRADFDLFWNTYPRKVSKKAALKAWLKLPPSDSLFAEIIMSLRLAIDSKQWIKDRGAFIPHASTWINGERWKDVLEPAAPSMPTEVAV